MTIGNQACLGQMSLFDLFFTEKKEYDPVTEYAMMGSFFSNGKKRIVDFFSENKKQSNRVSFLKNEYGIGGFGYLSHKPNVVHDAMYDAKSHEIQYNDENGVNREMSVSWAQLEREIDRLIAEGKYLAEGSD